MPGGGADARSGSRPLTPELTVRARALLTLVAAAVAAAAITRSAGAVVLAAPAAGVLATGLVGARRPRVTVAAHAAPVRVFEGGEVTVTLTVTSDVAVPVTCTPAVGAPVDAEPATVRPRAGGRETVRVVVRPLRWGRHDLGTVAIEARDPLGMVVWRGRRTGRMVVRVHPRGGVARAWLEPDATTAAIGVHVSRARGEGIEFAEVREFRAGDRARSINARISARRGRPYVNERHPERAADVVLFIDTYAGAGDDADGLARPATLDVALRAASAVAARHLARRDRVGLVRFGGIVSWLAPAQGERQRERIAETLLRTEIADSYVSGHVGALPRRAMPPQALVIAFSPLIDDRAPAALLALRRRGVDLVVVEIDVRPWIPRPRGDVEELALRLWTLRREARRARLRELGVPIAVLGAGEPVDRVLAELAAWRRGRRRGTVVR